MSACTASGVALLSASGASGDGRIVFGSAWPAGGFSGSLQQSNELNIYPDYVLHALTNSIVRLHLSLNGKRKSSDLATYRFNHIISHVNWNAHFYIVKKKTLFEFKLGMLLFQLVLKMGLPQEILKFRL